MARALNRPFKAGRVCLYYGSQDRVWVKHRGTGSLAAAPLQVSPPSARPASKGHRGR
jgi:hypothetical protein